MTQSRETNQEEEGESENLSKYDFQLMPSKQLQEKLRKKQTLAHDQYSVVEQTGNLLMSSLHQIELQFTSLLISTVCNYEEEILAKRKLQSVKGDKMLKLAASKSPRNLRKRWSNFILPATLLLLAISLNFNQIFCSNSQHNNHENSPPSRQQVRKQQLQRLLTSAVAAAATSSTTETHNHRQPQAKQLNKPTSSAGSTANLKVLKAATNGKKLFKLKPTSGNNHESIETTINTFDFGTSTSNNHNRKQHLQLEKILALAANAAASHSDQQLAASVISPSSPPPSSTTISSASSLSSSSSSSSSSASGDSATSSSPSAARLDNSLERETVTTGNSSSNINNGIANSSPVMDPRELVKSLNRNTNLKSRKSVSALDNYQQAVQHDFHQTFHDSYGNLFNEGPHFNLIPNPLIPPNNSISTTSDDSDFDGFDATDSPARSRSTLGAVSSPNSTGNLSGNRLPQRAQLAEQHAVLDDHEGPEQQPAYQQQGELHGSYYSQRPRSPSTYLQQDHHYIEAPESHSNEARSRSSADHSTQQHQSSNSPLDQMSSYLPEERQVIGPLAATDGRQPHNIKVIFNNNPQFIIGKDAATGHLDSPSSSMSSRNRSGGRSGGLRSSSLYNGDDFNQDESRIDETKVSETKVQAPIDHQHGGKTPCEKERQEKLGPNLEQIDLNQEPIIPTQAPVKQQQQQIIPEQLPVKQSKSLPPRQQPETLPQPLPQVQMREPEPVQQQQQQQIKSPLDEQVITPLDQMIKSGVRPPLRMVISMRNKNGDVMRVPINLQGSAKQQVIPPQPPPPNMPIQQQLPTLDLGPQMQIHFEPPIMEKAPPVAKIPQQIQQQQQQQIDENTPIGGDMFDPAIVKPFVKSPPKSRAESPMSKLIGQLKSIALPDQDEDDEQAPISPTPREKVAPPTRRPLPQTKVQQAEVIAKGEPQQAIPLPPIKSEPQIPQVVVQQEPASKVEPQLPAKQTPQQPTKQQEILPPPPAPPQLPIPQAQVQVPQVPQQEVLPQQVKTPQVKTKKANCHDDEQQLDVNPLPQQQVNTGIKQEAQKDADAPIIPPVALKTDLDNGIVQMMMPKLSSLHNKTFASMFAQFQQALSEQMQVHNIQVIKEPEQQQQVKVGPNIEQQFQEKQQHQTKQQDEQEDLMVAMMAANMRDGELMDGDRRMTMTVIKPPKGTSIKDAINAHARNSNDQTRAVAILHSIQNKVKRPGEQFSNPTAIDGRNLGNDNQPPARPVEISLRSNGNSLVNPPQLPPVSSEDPVDPDGFSSDLSISRQKHQQAPQETSRSRFKRDSDTQLVSATKQLEPSDKLVNQAAEHRNVGGGRKFISREPAKPVEKKSINKSAGKQLDSSDLKKAKKSVQKPSKFSKQHHHHQARGDTIDVAASQQNEVTEDDEPEEDSEAADSNADESSTSPSSGGSSSGGDAGDLLDDETSDMSDDSDDSSGFDSDDEPYNQGASSDRDYNSPTSFEIPQIDINPDTLKQKGCKTVLREVQEIPLDGLGAVRGDGQPGSGYGPAGEAANSMAGRRVKRSNENLINSRKVTSIVMTKECHFPNDPAEASTIKQQAKSGNQLGKQIRQQVAKPRQQQQQVTSSHKIAPVNTGIVLSSAIGSSPMESMVPHRPQHHLQLQQLPRRNVNAMYQSGDLEQAPFTRVDPKLAANFYNVQPQYQLLPSAQTQTGQYLLPTQAPSQEPQVRSTKQQQARMQLAIVQPMSSQIQQPQVSAIRRRSVRPTVLPGLSIASQAKFKTKETANDDHVGASSQVVARKLYKPPSADDPYHTLSYSSQTGADPDIDADDDDEIIMGPEDRHKAASSNRKQRHPPEANLRPRGNSMQSTASTTPRIRETLSDVERRALMDPNHEDTDPIIGPIDGLGKELLGKSYDEDDQGNRLNQIRDEDGSGKADLSDEADETDADFADESKPQEKKVSRHHRSNLNQNRRLDSRHQQLKPKGRVQNIISRKTISRRPMNTGPQGQQRESYGDSGIKSNPGTSDEEPSRFGRSFKFEHQVGRPQTQGLASQLKALKPGRQGFVSIEGDNGERQLVRLGARANSRQQQQTSRGPTKSNTKGESLPSQVKSSGKKPQDLQVAAAVKATRRQDDSAELIDPDEADEDGDEDDDETSPVRSGAASMRRDVGSNANLDSEDPDSDPDYNPKESQIPTYVKPKKSQKSFAYVHRDLPKKGAKNPDDFVISYGKGNLQTEHEDYDSDREHPHQHSSSNSSPINADDDQLRRRQDQSEEQQQAASNSSAGQQSSTPTNNNVTGR